MVVVGSGGNPYVTSIFRRRGVEVANEAQLYRIPKAFMKV
jgi:hypothetical protein